MSGITPALLDRLLHLGRKDHGARACPKCLKGYMEYVTGAGGGLYSCVECRWLEVHHPPWVPVAERKRP